MKTLKNVLLFISIVVSSDVIAQVYLIKDANGNVLAYEDVNGGIYNINSVPMVLVEEETSIVNELDDVLANYNPNTKTVLYEGSNLIVFTLNQNNEIVDAGNDVVGRIEQGGMVYNSNDELIGVGPGIPDFKLAYYFFFKPF